MIYIEELEYIEYSYESRYSKVYRITTNSKEIISRVVLRNSTSIVRLKVV